MASANRSKRLRKKQMNGDAPGSDHTPVQPIPGERAESAVFTVVDRDNKPVAGPAPSAPSVGVTSTEKLDPEAFGKYLDSKHDWVCRGCRERMHISLVSDWICLQCACSAMRLKSY